MTTDSVGRMTDDRDDAPAATSVASTSGSVAAAGLVERALAALVELNRRLETWGATGVEQRRAMAGDELVADATVSATRAITIDAPPTEIYPWLTQMGFRRAGWYSYDWIDNLGRESARHLDPLWQVTKPGARVPAGPIDFVATVVDPYRAFVLDLEGQKRIGFSLAFELVSLADDLGPTRLVSRARIAIRTPGGDALARWVLGPGDGVMVRRQLLGIRERAEAGPTTAAASEVVDLTTLEPERPSVTVTVTESTRDGGKLRS